MYRILKLVIFVIYNHIKCTFIKIIADVDIIRPIINI